jgi:hypothetical protein
VPQETGQFRSVHEAIIRPGRSGNQGSPVPR